MEYPRWPVSNVDGCPNGKSKNIFWFVQFSFYLPFDLAVNIDFGLDMGKGLAIFHN